MLTLWLSVATAIVAGLDWWAVLRGRTKVEEWAKPAVMVGLIFVGVSLRPQVGAPMDWTLLALGFGLVGDILLLPKMDVFIGGLSAFLIGHALYVIAIIKVGVTGQFLMVGLALGLLLLSTVGRRILGTVRGTRLAGPVAAYVVVIAAMVVAAVGSGHPLLAAGAISFAASDAVLGYDRFVHPPNQNRLWIMTLYHLGQAGMLAGIAFSTFQ